MTTDELLTATQVAAMLQISATAVYANKKLRALAKDHVGRLRWRRSDVAKLAPDAANTASSARFLTTDAMASRIGVSASWLRESHAPRVLLPNGRGKRMVRWDEQQVLGWIADNNPARMPKPAPGPGEHKPTVWSVP